MNLKHFRSVWCMLLAKVYEVFPLQCPNCSAEMNIIAFVTEVDSIKKILTHLGEDAEPPTMQSARAPPNDLVFDDITDDSSFTHTVYQDEFDQSVTW